MAEMISSAVAQEVVHEVLSRFKERCEHRRKSDAEEHMERMEMAHIRLEAALETSRRWIVTSAPLLRWQSKLKRAAHECDHALRRCRRRLQEEQDTPQRGGAAKRIARAARSFVSSIFGGGGDDDDELGGRAVRRFERFADGASEFLRYVELGGTPRRFMFFDPLVRHLLDGKGTKYCSVHGGRHLSFLLQPFNPPEHAAGMEATMLFLLEDGDAPENNFLFALGLRLSESTDIVGVVVRGLQLFEPHFSSTAEAVKKTLTQLPTQDLCWVPDAYYVFGRDEHRDNLHTISSKWIRPNPLCCQQQEHPYSTQRYAISSSSSGTLSESLPSESDAYLEPVTQVYLLGNVTLSSAGNNRETQRAVVDGEAGGFPYLKLGGLFWPHASSEDFHPGVRGSATETINGEATRSGFYADISFEQLGEIMLPKAADCLGGNVGATSHQMVWESKHGRGCLRAEKNLWRATACTRRGKKVQALISGMSEFIVSSWIPHAPAQLQASALDWIKKQERLPLPSLLKSTPCVHDCPIMLFSSQDYKRSLVRKIKSFSTNALKVRSVSQDKS